MPQIGMSFFFLLVVLAFPVGLLVWFALKKKQCFAPYLCGALCYLAGYMLLWLVASKWLERQFGYYVFVVRHPNWNLALMLLASGLVQVGGGWLAMRFLMKNSWNRAGGVAFGLGFAGFEAAFMMGAHHLNLLLYQQEALARLSPAAIFWAGFERISAYVMTAAVSLFIVRALRLKKPAWLVVALAGQMMGNLLVRLLFARGAAMFAIELCLAAYTAALLVLALKANPNENARKEENTTKEGGVPE